MKCSIEEKIKLEAILIKSILGNKDSFIHVTGIIQDAQIFDKPEHRIIYELAIKFYAEEGVIPDINDMLQIQILSQDENKGVVSDCLKGFTGVPEEFREIGNLAKRIIDMKAEIEMRSYYMKNTATGFDFIDSVTEYGFQLNQKYLGNLKTQRSNYEIAESLMTRIAHGTANNNFIKTGFERLDSITGGLPKGLTIIAARPSIGKTTYAMAICRKLMKQGFKPLIFSMEMKSDSLLIKNLAAATRIDSSKIETNKLTSKEKELLAHAVREYTGDNYAINDNPLQTTTSIRAEINRYMMRKQVDCVIIDYLSLIKPLIKQPNRPDREIGSISSEITAISHSTGIPVILISQLNRLVEARPDKKPQLSDLKESGQIEQDACLVMLLHYPSFYGLEQMKNSEYKFFTLEGEPLSENEFCQVIVAKNRFGRTGTCTFRFLGQYSIYEEVIAEKK